jgi:hypothetical protein
MLQKITRGITNIPTPRGPTIKIMGRSEDYKDGYQQGFESGYDGGFEKRSFNSALPENLARRGLKIAEKAPAPPPETAAATEQPVSSNITTTQTVAYKPTDDALVIILKDTELILELQSELSTGKNREGDKFTAKVVSPAEISGALIEGRIDKVAKPGRIKKRAQLSLSIRPHRSE